MIRGVSAPATMSDHVLIWWAGLAKFCNVNHKYPDLQQLELYSITMGASVNFLRIKDQFISETGPN